jgi:hypothetical protein
MPPQCLLSSHQLVMRVVTVVISNPFDDKKPNATIRVSFVLIHVGTIKDQLLSLCLLFFARPFPYLFHLFVFHTIGC